MSEPSEALVALVPNVELQAIFYREITGRYPSSWAAATAASASVLKKELSWKGVMTTM